MNEKEISVILTADEELKIMSGDNVWFTRAEPKIELEKLTLRDGPHGVRDGSPSFLYPNINLLACSWDRELLYRVGEYLGRDAKKKGVNVLLVSKTSTRLALTPVYLPYISRIFGVNGYFEVKTLHFTAIRECLLGMPCKARKCRYNARLFAGQRSYRKRYGKAERTVCRAFGTFVFR